MENITEMKSRLDELYQEYVDNKHLLNNTKTQETAKNIFDMTFVDGVTPADVAEQLSRFSTDTVTKYFTLITEGKRVPIDVIDEVIKEFIATDDKEMKSSAFVRKSISIASIIMKIYKNIALDSTQLPQLVAIITQASLRSEKMFSKTQSMVNNTDGAIYLLDYSNLKKKDLEYLWNATQKLYPDPEKAKYGDFILDWAQKYGFIPQNTTVPVSEEPLANEAALPVQPMLEQKEILVKNTGMKLDELHELLLSERNTILSEMSKALSPLCTSVTAMQTEVAKLQSMKEENIQLNLKLSALEKQNDEQIKRLQDAEQVLSACRVEKEQLSEQLQGLETAKAELEEKLKDAYALNSRESSMEAQKIRSELTKAFAFLYEDWQEFENLDVSEENYESLQAIIKKTFRALERNGISFKGNNT